MIAPVAWALTYWRLAGYNRMFAGCRAVSSVGRAPALHAGCQGFESLTAHQIIRLTLVIWGVGDSGYVTFERMIG